MESSLSLKLSDLEAEVGLFLGYGRGEDFDDTPWSDHQAAAIASCVRSGLRQFYFPPPLQGAVHEWSFLKPTATLTLASGDTTVDLPDDFGGLEGPLAVFAEDATRPWIVPVTGLVRQVTGDGTETGYPKYAEIEPLKGTGSQRSSRYRLAFWPTADEDYTIKLKYSILPEALTGDRPYAYGGAPHAETILESCLAIAEERLDDMQGVHKAKFAERLLASLHQDRKARPQALGYNADRSDGSARGWRRRRDSDFTVTFDDVVYD